MHFALEFVDDYMSSCDNLYPKFLCTDAVSLDIDKFTCDRSIIMNK